MIFVILILFLSAPLFCSGQTNLIPNGSFELLDSCPVGNFCGGLIEYAPPWYEPIDCSSDLLHTCNEGPCSSVSGIVSPYQGIGMAGQTLVGGFGNETREYIAVQLVSPLNTDSMYKLSVKLRYSGGNSSAVGSYGAFFSQDSVIDFSLNHTLFNLTPQLLRSPDSIMDNPLIWYDWEDTLVASGDEMFVMLGNFLNDENTPVLQPSWNPTSYYFVDDIHLTRIPAKPNSINELDVDFSVAPNPSSSILDISYKGNLRPSFIRLLTIDGREVFSEGWSESVDVSQFAEGVYLLQVEFGNGAVGMERVVISR